MSDKPEAWLRGPVEGIDPYLVPAAHGLIQVREDLARGEALTPAPREAAAAEKIPDPALGADRLVAGAAEAVERALAQMRATPRETLLESRGVGRAALPSNVLGLLFHLAEHAQRHTGQVIATAKAVRGSGLSETAAPPASRG